MRESFFLAIQNSQSSIKQISLNLSQRLFILLLASLLMTVGVNAEETSVMAKLAGQSLLLDGVSRDGLMTVVGERGHVLDSSDGRHWQQISVPTRTMLTGVYFHDKLNGWAVGHDAVILKTTDAGQQWQKVHDDPKGQIPLFDIWFGDDKRGIAIGAYGLYLVSEDAGKTWSTGEMNISRSGIKDAEESVEERAEDDDDFLDSYDLHLNSIAESDNGKLYIAAEAGKIYRSDDYGKSWFALSPPYIGSFFGVLPVEGDTVLVFGLRGHLFRSEDAGRSWQEIETPTNEMLTNGLKVSATEIYLTGLGGTILKTSDQGKTFTSLEQGHRDGFTAIIQSPEGKLITVGEKGVGLLK